VCHWCSYHILTTSVIYYWTVVWQRGIHLFYVIEIYRHDIYVCAPKDHKWGIFLSHFLHDPNAVFKCSDHEYPKYLRREVNLMSTASVKFFPATALKNQSKCKNDLTFYVMATKETPWMEACTKCHSSMTWLKHKSSISCYCPFQQRFCILLLTVFLIDKF